MKKLLVIIILLIAPLFSNAAIVELEGWAWSSNIGWISFNCKNISNACLSSNYKVTVDNSTGNFSGWAWSSNIGWITFVPALTSSKGAANYNSQTGQVTGWARACSGTINKDCSSPDRTDGWDGWIELSGVNHISPDFSGNRGVTFSSTTGKFNGYAWGSEVVGWVNFDTSIPVKCNNCTTPNPNPNPTSTNVICSLLGTGLNASNRPQWQAEATEGNDPIEFTWTNAVPGTESKIGAYVENYVGTSPLNPGDVLSGPTVSVVDDNGNTDSAICPSVVYDANTQLDLVLSQKDISDSSQGVKRLKVQVGKHAQSFVEFNNINTTSCTYNVSLQTLSGLGSGDPSQLQNADLNTSITPNVYNLRIDCLSNSGASASSTAILEIVNQAVFEEF